MIMDGLFFFILWGTFSVLVGFVWMSPARVAAWLIRPFHGRLFPLAHRIARSMRLDRGTWAYDAGRKTISHGPSKLEVHIGYGGSSGIRVNTGAGFWEPNPIERRIIADAFNTLTREEARRAVETHMPATDDGPERPMLTHEPMDPVTGLDRRP
jgi:hypothetical protein